MDSKFEKWNELPTEMRYECVKWMDFMSRMMLRATSHTEKSLVESAPKIHFDSVKIDWDIYTPPSIICKEGSVETNQTFRRRCTEEILRKGYQYLALLLKFAVIDHFEFWSRFMNDYETSQFCSKISNIAPIKFKTLHLDIEHHNIIKMLLEKCEKIEKLVLRGDEYGEFDDVTSFICSEAFYTAKTVQLKDMSWLYTPCVLMEKWIEFDVQLGTAFQARCQSSNFIDYFAQNMKNRVVSKTDTELRLSTENPMKHILLRVVATLVDSFILFLVIPADQKKLEYEKHDQWAEDFDKYDEETMKHQLSAFYVY